MPDRVVPRRTYLLVCAVLLLLTGATVGVAHVNLHGWNAALGLGFAVAKALLIALFFMHLRTSSPMTRLVGLAALFWLGLLLAGTMTDVLTRDWLPIPGK